MRIIDHTSTANIGLIRDLVRFCKPDKVSKFDMRIKSCESGYHGSAFVEGSWGHRRSIKSGRGTRVIHPWFIELHLMPPGQRRFPYSWPEHGAYLAFTARTEAETILYLLAHELRHLQQHIDPTLKKAPGSRGKYSERDADTYAIRCVKRWRKALAKNS